MSLKAIEVDAYEKPLFKDEKLSFHYEIDGKKFIAGEPFIFGSAAQMEGFTGPGMVISDEEAAEIDHLIDMLDDYEREVIPKISKESVELDEYLEKSKAKYVERAKKMAKQVLNFPTAPGPYFFLHKFSAMDMYTEGRKKLLMAQAQWVSVLRAAIIGHVQAAIHHLLPLRVITTGLDNNPDTFHNELYVWNPPRKMKQGFAAGPNGMQIPIGALPDPNGGFDVKKLEPDAVRDFPNTIKAIVPPKEWPRMVKEMQARNTGIVVATEEQARKTVESVMKGGENLNKLLKDGDAPRA